MIDPASAVEAYQAAWAEPDDDKRRELLERGWADDGVFVDPQARVEGRDALVEHIAGFLKTFPGHAIEATTGLQHYEKYLRFGWRMVDPAGTSTLEGVDFGEFAEDGRVSLIVGFWGPWPELG